MACLAATFAATTAALAQPTDTLARIKDSGVINIGSRDTQIPFSYR